MPFINKVHYRPKVVHICDTPKLWRDGLIGWFEDMGFIKTRQRFDVGSIWECPMCLSLFEAVLHGGGPFEGKITWTEIDASRMDELGWSLRYDASNRRYWHRMQVLPTGNTGKGGASGPSALPSTFVTHEERESLQ